MTAPTEPMPGASADDPSAHTALDPHLPQLPHRVEPQRADPKQTEPEAKPDDIDSLPAWAQKALRDARADAARSRTSAKQTAAEEARQELAAQVARALGYTDEEEVDPDALTEQIQQAQAAAWRSGVELQVHRAAGRIGADAEALLDSNAFIDTLDDLVDEDPRSPEFAAQLEAKVQAALEKHPKYRAATGQAPAAPRPDPSQGPRGAAPQARPTSLFAAIERHIAQK